MNLLNKKKLAAKTLSVGIGRVELNNNRLEEIKRFFETGLADKEFLAKNRIAYIYLTKPLFNLRFDRQSPAVDNMYQVAGENDVSLLLQVK